MVGYKRKSLKSEVDVSLLRELREQGMTNKQIASYVGVSVATVYKYIGKRSMDVRKAEEQNKPCPIPEADVLRYSEPDGVETTEDTSAPVDIPEIEPAEEEAPVEIPKTSGRYPWNEGDNSTEPLLKIVREVRILDLDGSLCGYHVDPTSGDVEFKGDLIHGMLDRGSIGTFIQELIQIQGMLDQ